MNKTITTLTAAALIGAALSAAAPAHALDAPQQHTAHFAFEHGLRWSWTVPSGTTAVTITAAGGAGGHGDDQSLAGAGVGANGGFGALVTETIGVVPGDILTIAPGGAGAGDTVRGNANWDGDHGGYGTFSASDGATDVGGGGGGAATNVELNSTLVAVAGGGGGGGAGGAVVHYDGGAGGNAGADGVGGSGSGAGAGGSGALIGLSSAESGEDSPTNAADLSAAGGGGGGGAGWDGSTYGGGHAGRAGTTDGGGGGGGAGGRSYASDPSGVIGTAPVRGDGYVDLTWTEGITTTTTLAANPIATAGQADTLTATVTRAATNGQPTATGTITFVDFAPFATTPTTLATVPVKADGTATWTGSNLAQGTHGFRAIYSGDDTYVGSGSSFVYQTVAAPPVPPRFSANPVAFAPTTVGTTRTLTVFETNLSQTPVSWDFIVPSGVTQIESGSTCFQAGTLAPNAACTWIIDYTPTLVGEDDGSILFDFGASGQVLLQVTGSGVAVAPPPVAKPMVTAISPKGGPAAGGTLVTLTGHNLASATKITAGGVRLTSVHCTGSTKCTGRTPAGHGTVDLRVTTAGGTSSAVVADRFTYKS